jgi:hypothetical protein
VNFTDPSGLLVAESGTAIAVAKGGGVSFFGAAGGPILLGALAAYGGSQLGLYINDNWLPIPAPNIGESSYVSPLAGGSGGPPPTPTPRVGTGMGDSCPIDPKQLGHKWGQHKNDYPDWTHKDYMNRINDMYGNQSLPRYTYPNDAPLYRGETHIVQGKDLLRLDPNGGFRSLYPGASTTYPNGFPPK